MQIALLVTVAVMLAVAVPQDGTSGGMDLLERMFDHAFGAYMRYAFPHDELRPVSCDGRVLRERGDLDFNLANVSMTYIDALDALVLFDRLEDFGEAVEYITHNVTFDRDVLVSAFEMNIRVLGGLISGHLHAKRMGIPSGYHDGLLSQAIDLGDRLYKAFDTATGLPASRINLAHGLEGDDEVPKTTSVAEAGSWLLEFGTLSLLTGDPKYYTVARNALDFLWHMRLGDAALLPTTISPFAGLWLDSLSSGAGPGHDSYYEYLLKGYVLFGDVELYDRFMDHYQGITAYQAGGQFTFDIANDVPAHSQVSPLQGFWGGVVNSIQGPSAYATSVTRMWSRLWDSMGGLPEVADITGGQVSLLGYGKDYNLRPELAESLAQLGAATVGGVEDESYKWKLEAMAGDIEKRNKAVCGYASLADVLGHRHDDRMDSFFLSETLPYMFIGTNPPDVVTERLGTSAMARVHTTEAHVLPLKELTPLVGPEQTRTRRSGSASRLMCPEGPSPVQKLVVLVDWQLVHGAWTVWPQFSGAPKRAAPTAVTVPIAKTKMVLRGEAVGGEETVFNLTVGRANFGGKMEKRSGMKTDKMDWENLKRTRLTALIHSSRSLRSSLKQRKSCLLDNSVHLNVTRPRESSYGLQWKELPLAQKAPSMRIELAANGSEFACEMPNRVEFDSHADVMLVVRRGGNCSFTEKALHAQLTGAKGVLILDDAPPVKAKKSLVMFCETNKAWICRHVHIPVFSVPVDSFTPVLALLKTGARLYVEGS